MRELNMHRLRERYGGRYVALWKNRVVASGRSHASLMKKILPLYRTRPLAIMCVPPKGMACVYSLSA